MDVIGIAGYCDTTTYNSGVCATDSKGSFHWPLTRTKGRNGSVAHSNKDIEGMRDCLHECLSCSGCHYVSFSRTERDCSWYRKCDLNHLGTQWNTFHHSRKVREPNGTVSKDVVAFLETQRIAVEASRSRPRLVDLVVYGGPHYDALLELRMHELSRVDLFVVVEHQRPGGMATGRTFNLTSTRFLPYASRTKHIVVSKQLNEFVDFEMQVAHW